MSKTTFVTVLGYIIGHEGNVHIFWAAPVGISAVVAYFLRLNRDIRKPIIEISNVVGQLAEGDLNVKINASYLSQNNEIGGAFRSLN